MAAMTRKPFHDTRVDPPKPPGPTDHAFEAAWYSEPRCTRCRRTASETEGKPCWTDEQIKAGLVVARLRQARA